MDENVGLVVDRLERLVQFLRAENFNRQDPGALTTRQVILMNCIADNPGISVNDLAALTYLDQTSITTMLRRLDDRDLTVRKYSLRDRRCREIYLTDMGLARLQLAQAMPIDKIRGALRHMPAPTLAISKTGWRF